MEITEQIGQTKWSIDQAHSEITFKVRHLMIAHVKGKFKTFDASIYTRGKNFKTAEIDMLIEVSSISTDDEKRDEHLLSEEFFDAKKHNQISFVSSTIAKKDESGNHELWGELTIKGITKTVVLNVEFGGIIKDPWGNEKAGFTVTGKIHRADFGLTMNVPLEGGGVVVGEEVSISCDIELTKISQNDLVMELDTEANKNSI